MRSANSVEEGESSAPFVPRPRRSQVSDAKDLKLKLKELLIERLKFEEMAPDDIDDDEPLFEGGLGLDSIDALEIVVLLESEFGIKVRNESSAREFFRSISTLAQYIQEKKSAEVEGLA